MVDISTQYLLYTTKGLKENMTFKKCIMYTDVFAKI